MDSDDEAVLMAAILDALGLPYRFLFHEGAVTVEWLSDPFDRVAHLLMKETEQPC